MIQHNLIQGSRRWKKHRENYRNASDTPVVMGLSPYKTRGLFLKEKVLGITVPPTPGEQYLFDLGHRFEALARPRMEELVGEHVFQTVCTDGPWSASLDGITLLGKVLVEHKIMNEDIRQTDSIHTLPTHYKAQMEHQLMVTGAERVLFLATNWDQDDELREEVWLWYEPNYKLRQGIVESWEEFDREVAMYREVLDSIPAMLLTTK